MVAGGLQETFREGWAVQYGHIFSKHADRDNELGFYAVVVDEIFTDPCRGGGPHGRRIPRGDLVTALLDQPGPTKGTPVSSTLAGYPATRIDLEVPPSLDLAKCRLAEDDVMGLQAWKSRPADKYFVLLPGQRASVYVVDVHGRRQILLVATGAGTSATDKAELKAALDSIRIQRPGLPRDVFHGRRRSHRPAAGQGSVPQPTRSPSAARDATPRPTGDALTRHWTPLRPDTSRRVTARQAQIDEADTTYGGIDIREVNSGDPTHSLSWGIKLRERDASASTLDPARRVIEHGLVFDTDRDGAADCQIGINTDAPKRGQQRVWVKNLTTGVTDEKVGGPCGVPFDFAHPSESTAEPPLDEHLLLVWRGQSLFLPQHGGLLRIRVHHRERSGH